MAFGHEKRDAKHAAVNLRTKLGARGYAVREELGAYRASQFDTDADADTNCWLTTPKPISC